MNKKNQSTDTHTHPYALDCSVTFTNFAQGQRNRFDERFFGVGQAYKSERRAIMQPEST